MSTYEIISITISSIGLASIIIMAISLIVSIHGTKQLRKSKAADAITYYIKSTTDIISYSVWIISSFSQEQCNCLHKLKDFSVDVKELDKICYICPHREFCRKDNNQMLCKRYDNRIILHKDIRFFLRENVLLYLNNLECVLLNWELGVVDQRIIEKELSFLEHIDDVYEGLEKMRLLFGGADAYPAIEEYYKSLNKNKKRKPSNFCNNN